MALVLVIFFICFILANLYLFYFHKTAKILSAFIILGIFPYFYCLFCNEPLGVDNSFSHYFNLRFLKYAIVNVPSLYLIYYILNFDSIKNKKAGSLVLTLSFATNIAWTLSYGFGKTMNRQLISAMAILLVIILFLRLRTLRAENRLGFEMNGSYLHSNLICWNYLIPYTLWNILFVDSVFGQYELRIWHNLLPFVMLIILKIKDQSLSMHSLGKIYLAIRALTLGLWMSAYSYYQVLFEGTFKTRTIFMSFPLTRPICVILVLWLIHLLFIELQKYIRTKGMQEQ